MVNINIMSKNFDRPIKTADKIKKFTYSSCSIINISINTHENNYALVVKLVDTRT